MCSRPLHPCPRCNNMTPAQQDEWDALVRMLRSYTLRKCGQVPAGITIRLTNGDKLRLPLPLPAGELAPSPPPVENKEVRPICRAEWASGPEPRHLSDFRAVYWPGLGRFAFTGKQAAAVRLLWEAMDDGSWEVGQNALLTAVGSDCLRLRDLFRRSPAWGAVIIQGTAPGMYRLPPGAVGDLNSAETLPH